jgi:DNA polymerase III epsilon subunit-like protein
MPLPLLLLLIAIGICVVAYLIRTNGTKTVEQNPQQPTRSAPQRSQFLPGLPRRFTVLDLETTGFDIGFLLSAANKNGHVITNRYCCALRLARRAWPGLPSYRLSELAKRGKLSGEDTHRALGDCKRTLIIFTAAASEVGSRIKWTTPNLEHHQDERLECQSVPV